MYSSVEEFMTVVKTKNQGEMNFIRLSRRWLNHFGII